MKASTRILISLGMLLICFFCIYFPLNWILPDLDKTDRNISALGISILLSIFLFLITKGRTRKFVTQLLRTALIIGFIGFTIGFIGPIIFSPESNQGPLLGIFITGPLSFLAGLIGGGVYWSLKDHTSLKIKEKQ